MSPTNKLPISQAILYIVFSVFIFSGMPSLIWTHQYYKKKERKQNSRYTISFLEQTGPIKEAVKSEHLEELLKLSSNCPQNLFAYDLKEGENLLLNSQVIKEAKLSADFPNTLIINYIARKPMAFLSDYENVVIDDEGALFPLSPYYTPKVLPKVYMGIQIEPFAYGIIEDEKWIIAKEILIYFKRLNVKGLRVHKIDVSKIRADSMGKREVILTLYDKLGKKEYIRYLRLTKDGYIDEIEHFMSLKQMSLADDLIVDLRLLPNAYLMPVSEASL